MQNQKLCLKWNNHMSNMLSLLGSFQQKDMLVDVTISCQGQNIKAHKVILSACSPYFQEIFMENPCQHPIIIINGMKFEDISAILNFMYKGEVNVSHDGLSSFLQAAEALKVKGLAEVCGEKKGTNSISQEVQQSELNRPQRTDTPPRKRPRNRKRSLSDSNRSDDEGLSRKHREPSSPEIHELSGDESFTGDNSSNGPPFNSISRVPQNVYSRSHQSSSNMGGEDDDEYDVESTKMLEQTDSNVSMNNTNTDNNLRIERIMGNATEIESSSMADPESPPDIKPIINFEESRAGPSESGNLMLYNEQSQPGPSNVQDSSLLQHDNSHAQGVLLAKLYCRTNLLIEKINNIEKKISSMPGIVVNASLDVDEIPAITKHFPMRSMKHMDEFENFLHKESNYKLMVNFLKKIGGSSLYKIVTNILKRVMHDELAEQYSLMGAKGKRAFKTLLFTNAILDIVRLSFKETTEQEVESVIGNWLRHAKERKDGQKKKGTGCSKTSSTSAVVQSGPTVVQLRN